MIKIIIILEDVQTFEVTVPEGAALACTMRFLGSLAPEVMHEGRIIPKFKFENETWQELPDFFAGLQQDGSVDMWMVRTSKGSITIAANRIVSDLVH